MGDRIDPTPPLARHKAFVAYGFEEGKSRDMPSPVDFERLASRGHLFHQSADPSRMPSDLVTVDGHLRRFAVGNREGPVSTLPNGHRNEHALYGETPFLGPLFLSEHRILEAHSKPNGPGSAGTVPVGDHDAPPKLVVSPSVISQCKAYFHAQQERWSHELDQLTDFVETVVRHAATQTVALRAPQAPERSGSLGPIHGSLEEKWTPTMLRAYMAMVPRSHLTDLYYSQGLHTDGATASFRVHRAPSRVVQRIVQYFLALQAAKKDTSALEDFVIAQCRRDLADIEAHRTPEAEAVSAVLVEEGRRFAEMVSHPRPWTMPSVPVKGSVAGMTMTNSRDLTLTPAEDQYFTDYNSANKVHRYKGDGSVVHIPAYRVPPWGDKVEKDFPVQARKPMPQPARQATRNRTGKKPSKKSERKSDKVTKPDKPKPKSQKETKPQKTKAKDKPAKKTTSGSKQDDSESERTESEDERDEKGRSKGKEEEGENDQDGDDPALESTEPPSVKRKGEQDDDEPNPGKRAKGKTKTKPKTGKGSNLSFGPIAGEPPTEGDTIDASRTDEAREVSRRARAKVLTEIWRVPEGKRENDMFPLGEGSNQSGWIVKVFTMHCLWAYTKGQLTVDGIDAYWNKFVKDSWEAEAYRKAVVAPKKYIDASEWQKRVVLRQRIISANNAGASKKSMANVVERDRDTTSPIEILARRRAKKLLDALYVGGVPGAVVPAYDTLTDEQRDRMVLNRRARWTHATVDEQMHSFKLDGEALPFLLQALRTGYQSAYAVAGDSVPAVPAFRDAQDTKESKTRGDTTSSSSSSLLSSSSSSSSSSLLPQSSTSSSTSSSSLARQPGAIGNAREQLVHHMESLPALEGRSFVAAELFRALMDLQLYDTVLEPICLAFFAVPVVEQYTAIHSDPLVVPMGPFDPALGLGEINARLVGNQPNRLCRLHTRCVLVDRVVSQVIPGLHEALLHRHSPVHKPYWMSQSEGIGIGNRVIKVGTGATGVIPKSSVVQGQKQFKYYRMTTTDQYVLGFARLVSTRGPHDLYYRTPAVQVLVPASHEVYMAGPLRFLERYPDLDVGDVHALWAKVQIHLRNGLKFVREKAGSTKADAYSRRTREACERLETLLNREDFSRMPGERRRIRSNASGRRAPESDSKLVDAQGQEYKGQLPALTNPMVVQVVELLYRVSLTLALYTAHTGGVGYCPDTQQRDYAKVFAYRGDPVPAECKTKLRKSSVTSLSSVGASGASEAGSDPDASENEEDEESEAGSDAEEQDKDNGSNAGSEVDMSDRQDNRDQKVEKDGKESDVNPAGDGEDVPESETDATDRDNANANRDATNQDNAMDDNAPATDKDGDVLMRNAKGRSRLDHRFPEDTGSRKQGFRPMRPGKANHAKHVYDFARPIAKIMDAGLLGHLVRVHTSSEVRAHATSESLFTTLSMLYDLVVARNARAPDPESGPPGSAVDHYFRRFLLVLLGLDHRRLNAVMRHVDNTRFYGGQVPRAVDNLAWTINVLPNQTLGHRSLVDMSHTLVRHDALYAGQVLLTDPDTAFAKDMSYLVRRRERHKTTAYLVGGWAMPDPVVLNPRSFLRLHHHPAVHKWVQDYFALTSQDEREPAGGRVVPHVSSSTATKPPVPIIPPSRPLQPPVPVFHYVDPRPGGPSSLVPMGTGMPSSFAGATGPYLFAPTRVIIAHPSSLVPRTAPSPPFVPSVAPTPSLVPRAAPTHPTMDMFGDMDAKSQADTIFGDFGTTTEELDTVAPLFSGLNQLPDLPLEDDDALFDTPHSAIGASNPFVSASATAPAVVPTSVATPMATSTVTSPAVHTQASLASSATSSVTSSSATRVFPDAKKLEYFKDTQERSAQSARLARLVVVPSHDHPVLVVAFGPPGSGKSSIVTKVLGPVLGVRDFVDVNVDNVIEGMTEFENLAARVVEAMALDPDANADETKARIEVAGKEYLRIRHDYADGVVDDMMDYALETHKNVVFETTGRVSQFNIELLKRAYGHGYRTVVVWPYADEKEIQERVVSRARKTGRLVPREFVTDMFKKASENFLIVAPFADDVYLFENSNLVPLTVQSLLFEQHARRDAKDTWVACSKRLQKMRLYNSASDKWDTLCESKWNEPGFKPKHLEVSR